MIVVSLQSGSNGNCIYVEGGGVKLLFDAGISGRQAEMRLAARGRDIRDVDALVISHDHADHIRCAGIYNRKFQLPVYATAATLSAARDRYGLGAIGEAHHFEAGEVLRFGPLAVETIPTPHDGVDGVAFIVTDGRRRLGILTDLGHVFDGLGDVIGSLDAVLIESNYDPHLLASGRYPAFLKHRIRGPAGHLSNAEAAELLSACAGKRMKWACLAHLSGENNDPQLALDAHRAMVAEGLALHVATRYAATQPLTL